MLKKPPFNLSHYWILFEKSMHNSSDARQATNEEIPSWFLYIYISMGLVLVFAFLLIVLGSQ